MVQHRTNSAVNITILICKLKIRISLFHICLGCIILNQLWYFKLSQRRAKADSCCSLKYLGVGGRVLTSQFSKDSQGRTLGFFHLVWQCSFRTCALFTVPWYLLFVAILTVKLIRYALTSPCGVFLHYVDLPRKHILCCGWLSWWTLLLFSSKSADVWPLKSMG